MELSVYLDYVWLYLPVLGGAEMQFPTYLLLIPVAVVLLRKFLARR
jgi:hypothetical protein